MPEIYKTADDHVLAERLSLGMKSITLKQFLSGGGLMQCFLLYIFVLGIFKTALFWKIFS